MNLGIYDNLKHQSYTLRKIIMLLKLEISKVIF